MLVEKEAFLVAGLDEFGVSERATEQEATRVSQTSLFESRLIARLNAGEMSAFDELVEEFQPLVYALSFRILNDPEDARDAAQETFLKIYRHFARFRGDASLKTWICRIAINQAYSTQRWWRRRYRNSTDSLDAPLGLNDDDRSLADSLESDAVSPETEALSRERGRRVEASLCELKKDFRVAVILRDIEGLSYEEIAYVTEVSVGTVKSRIARGRDMLREVVQAGEVKPAYS
ncbi:MAG: sigma-70 family RNA polymerase sigma factor [Blastocatellia bacterium]